MKKATTTLTRALIGAMAFNRASSIVFAAVLVLGAVVAESRADLAFGIPEAPLPTYQQLGNDGFVFTPTSDIFVTALDYYISPYPPENGTLLDAHPVGIYDVNGDHLTPIVQTIVGPGSAPVVGDPPGTSQFLSQAISPVELLAGNSYMLSGLAYTTENENGGAGPQGNALGIAIGDIAVASGLTLNGYFYDYGTTLDYPTTPYGTAYFGPNLEFTVASDISPAAAVVPEAGSALVFVGVGLLGCPLLRRRSHRNF